VIGGPASPVEAAEMEKYMEKESVALSVYNLDLALVKDVRRLSLTMGTSEVRLDDVASSIDPTSVHFAALDHPGAVAVLEQNYQYDLADADRILDRYLNHPVTVVLKEGDTREGVLLSFSDSGLVLDAGGDGAVIVNRAEVRDMRLGQIPGGLVVKPTLVWTLASDRAGDERCELSYLTESISWHAEYVAVVSAQDDALTLDGWVSLDNKSGATYENAKLKLVAGDVNRVQEPSYMRMRSVALADMARAPERRGFEERDFFEYHIYTLARPATVADRETKQLSLFPAASASVEKVLTYDGARNDKKVTVRLEFKNAKDNGLGMALPAGKVRVYKEDQDGALEFVGEDRIDHTPRDEKVRLLLGSAFDVVGERKRTNFTKLSDSVHEETFEIEIRNHKDKAVKVMIVERLDGDWQMLENSREFEKKEARRVEFPVQVDADGTAKVTYRVRTTW
jgi:hypothetical protein